MSDNNHTDKDFENSDEDITFEEDEPQVNSFGQSKDAKTRKLEEKLSKCQEEKEEYLDGWQRAKADFVNLKKRSEEERSNIITKSKANFINDLLPVIDSFDMAMKDQEAWNSAPENWRKGIESIHSQLNRLLNEYDVMEISETGIDLDPNQHEAIDSVEVTDDQQDGKVIEVVQKGYKINDRVIRPASVKVGRKT